jgi:hypothetical protein
MNSALRKPEHHRLLAECSAGAMGRAKAWLYRADWKKGPGYVSLSSRARSKPTPAAAAGVPACLSTPTRKSAPNGLRSGLAAQKRAAPAQQGGPRQTVV